MIFSLSRETRTQISLREVTCQSYYFVLFLGSTRGSGTEGNNYNSLLQEEHMNSRLNYQQANKVVDSSQIQKNWIPRSFSNGSEVLSLNAYKPINQDFPLDCTVGSSGNITATFQGLSTDFPASSASKYGYPTSFGQYLFDLESQTQQPQFNNQPAMKFNYPSNANKTPLWNASTAASLADGIRPGLFTSSQSQYLAPTFEKKPKFSNLTVKVNIGLVLGSNFKPN